MRTIRDHWMEYRIGVLPKTAPQVQVTECRRAFFAGAMAFFTLMNEASADPKSEEQGAAELEKLHQELMGFYANVGTENEG